MLQDPNRLFVILSKWSLNKYFCSISEKIEVSVSVEKFGHDSNAGFFFSSSSSLEAWYT